VTMSKIREALNAPLANDQKCSYCNWLSTLDAEDRAAIIESYSSELTTSEILRRLEPYGIPVTHHPFQLHRKGRHSEEL
jgi:hypothetical protein